MGLERLVVLAIVVSGCLSSFSLPLAAQDTFQDEIANLRSPNVGTRVNAAKALGKSGRLEGIPALTQAMRDPELKVRRVTIEALRAFTSSETVDGLLIGLQDEDRSVRREALTAALEIYVGAGNADIGSSLSWILGNRKRTPELEGLIPTDLRVVNGVELRLQDEEPHLRRQAAYTLGVLGAARSARPLESSLYDGDKNVRLEAVRSLAKIGTDEAAEAVRGALNGADKTLAGAVIDALGKMQYQKAAPELVVIYDADVNKLGDRALAALAHLGAPEARGVFYYQMTSKNSERRRWAVEGLGRLGDSGIASGLVKDFLREPDPTVQLAYCFALVQLGRIEFIDRVALDLGNRKRHEQAFEYAVELGSGVLGELVRYLTDPVPAVRIEMARVLMAIGDPAAIPHLQPLLSDPNSKVADSANRAIARLKQGRLSASAAPIP
ncbi:MAG: HEAT repeat domain-containing protein [Acidobacteria bacterium]|nr:MAG: HEAT repeat domain-containing protein [Acidobacteriota bacterium]